MYLNQLIPRGRKFIDYIPSYLTDQPLDPAIIYSMSPYFVEELKEWEYVSFVTGLSNLHSILSGNHPDAGQGTKSAWFMTDEVVDVRLLFRKASDKSRGNPTLGSKMRLYSMGKPHHGGGDSVVQSIDSGFITYNSFPTDDIFFQKAMAKTMFYNSLYAIGGRASIRKVNEKNEISPTPPVFKWLSAVQPRRSDNTNWDDYDHLLYPAAMAAGIDNPTEFFGDGLGGHDTLDKILDALTLADSLDDFCDRMMDIKALGLYQEDIDLIVDTSNDSRANKDNSSDFSDGKAQGVNIVDMMGNLNDIFG